MESLHSQFSVMLSAPGYGETYSVHQAVCHPPELSYLMSAENWPVGPSSVPWRLSMVQLTCAGDRYVGPVYQDSLPRLSFYFSGRVSNTSVFTPLLSPSPEKRRSLLLALATLPRTFPFPPKSPATWVWATSKLRSSAAPRLQGRRKMAVTSGLRGHPTFWHPREAPSASVTCFDTRRRSSTTMAYSGSFRI